jgi:transposase
MRAYSKDLRDRVITAYNKKMPMEKIVETFNICKATAQDWIKRFETTGDYSSKQGLLGQPSYKFNDKERILEFLRANPDADGISIRDAVATEVAMSTFYDTLKRMEITFKKKSRNTKNVKK